jgi:hypothetical protein
LIWSISIFFICFFMILIWYRIYIVNIFFKIIPRGYVFLLILLAS